ncbi:MAG TPA: transporter [Chroococcales cyanobacterium]
MIVKKLKTKTVYFSGLIARRATAPQLLLLCFLALSQPAQAQTLDKSDTIDTNRPSFMSSPLVVPKASVQIENGSTYQWNRQNQWQFDLPESQLRVGVAKNLEFQMFLPNYKLARSNILSSSQQPRVNTLSNEPAESTSSFVTNLSEVGAKYQFGQFLDKKSLPVILRGSQAALIMGITVPTGSPVAARTGTQGSIRLPWSRPLPKGWRIAGMESVLYINDGTAVQWQPDVLVGKSFGQKADCFLEYGGFFTSGNLPIQFMHTGAVYRPSKRHQVDAHFGVGLSKSSPIGFVGIGYSYRFDRLSW